VTPEGKIKAAVKRELTAIGAYHHWPVQNGMGAPCLDCHGCYKGMYFAIETKRPGGVPTVRQDETIRQIATARGLVFVVSSNEGVKSIGVVLEEEHARRYRYS